MLYYFLYPLHNLFSLLNVFRYITFRSVGATLTAFFLVLFLGNAFIRLLKEKQIGQVVRDDGPATHFSKRGVPTMGGMLILFAVIGATLLWVDLTNYYIWLILAVTLWFGGVGAYDDYCKIKKKTSEGLRAKGKLLLQLLAAGAVGIILFNHPDFDGHLSFPFFKNIHKPMWLPFAIRMKRSCRDCRAGSAYPAHTRR
jgi:phospho-N-acetylmuramoyl-pentapeptide-transferase